MQAQTSFRTLYCLYLGVLSLRILITDVATKDSPSKQQSRNLIIYSKENGTNIPYTNLLKRNLFLETSINSNQE